MIATRARRSGEEELQPNFWASYSDLMAGMLLVFVLLLIVAMSHYAEFNSRQTEKLTSFRTIELRLIDSLEEAFEGERVSINADTGALEIGSGILFGSDESELSEDGREKLAKIFDAYIRIILSPDVRPYIKQIEIEGHTDSNGGYLYNLELSQRRALSVMKEFLKQGGDDNVQLQEMVVAGGRSYTQLIRDQNGVEDKERSRRIEIKFRLNEREMFQKIYQDAKERAN